MIESLISVLKIVDNRFNNLSEKFKIKEKNYAILTLHRPSNVDNFEKLREIMDTIQEISNYIKIIFPAHPRTLKNLKHFDFKNVLITKPLRYLDFISLLKFSKFVLTDSGGIQEETTYLKIPCLTLRENTERPITVEKGTNVLVGTSKEKIIYHFNEIMNNNFKKGLDIEFWDEFVSKRILNAFINYLSNLL